MNIFINYKVKLVDFFKLLEKDKIIKLPEKFDNFSVEIPNGHHVAQFADIRTIPGALQCHKVGFAGGQKAL